MPFRLVLLQDQADFLIQQPVDIPESFRHILVYRAFGNAEAFRSGPNGGLVLHDELRQCSGPFFDAVRMNPYHSPCPGAVPAPGLSGESI